MIIHALAMFLFALPLPQEPAGGAPRGPAAEVGTTPAKSRPRTVLYSQRFAQRPGKESDPSLVAISAGLEWLRHHQAEDGHWDVANFMQLDTEGTPCTGPGKAANDVAVTSLALLAFLGNGNTRLLGPGPYRRVVAKGTKWLLEQQGEDGKIGTANTVDAHAIAALTLSEACGLSQPNRQLQDKAQRALDFLAKARMPASIWTSEQPDTVDAVAQTAWVVQALHAGWCFRLDVDEQAFVATKQWFDKVTNPENGTVDAHRLGGKSTEAKIASRTAAVLLCRELLGDSPKDVPAMQKAADAILKQLPVWNTSNGSIDMLYWYYASYAMFQLGGKHWDTWSKAMTEAILNSQRKESDGNLAGSWDPVDPWGQDGGRVYATAMMVLCLEAPFRFARLDGGK